jgi:hypothetical protein
MLLARHPKDADPDAKASGESRGNNPKEKARFFLGIFPAFYGPEAFKISFHRSNGRKLSAFPNQVYPPIGVQRTKSFGSGV